MTSILAYSIESRYVLVVSARNFGLQYTRIAPLQVLNVKLVDRLNVCGGHSGLSQLCAH